MEKYYRFAGVTLAIDIPDDKMYLEDRHLGKFCENSVIEPDLFQIRITEYLDEPEGDCLLAEHGFHIYRAGETVIRYIGATKDLWGNGYCRVSRCGKFHDVQLKTENFPERIGVKTVLGALGAEHLVVRAGGVILHASYIVHEGRAILFTAPSETGKSTQAELWRELRGAKIVNGDRAAMRMEDGAIMACGIPFAGSSQYCENVTAPLAAIVCLGQAPQTTIRPLRGYPAFRRIWEGCSVNTWDQTDVEMATSLVQKILETVPVFQLDCTPDESAVIALEEKLREQVNQ